MKKGKVLLNALIVMRKLKPICDAYEISYKYAHSLASTNKNPSWFFMNSIKDIIPTSFWFDEADSKYIQSVKEHLEKELKLINSSPVSGR